LQEWSKEKAIEAAREVAETMETPGWRKIVEAAESYRLFAYSYLENKPASDSGATYAQIIGQSKGVALIESIAAGIVRNGEEKAKAQAGQGQEEN
jgi:hypothetical protein